MLRYFGKLNNTNSPYGRQRGLQRGDWKPSYSPSSLFRTSVWIIPPPLVGRRRSIPLVLLSPSGQKSKCCDHSWWKYRLANFLSLLVTFAKKDQKWFSGDERGWGDIGRMVNGHSAAALFIFNISPLIGTQF